MEKSVYVYISMFVWLNKSFDLDDIKMFIDNKEGLLNMYIINIGIKS